MMECSARERGLVRDLAHILRGSICMTVCVPVSVCISAGFSSSKLLKYSGNNRLAIEFVLNIQVKFSVFGVQNMVTFDVFSLSDLLEC